MAHQRNPFIYGRPVRGSECLCREQQLQTVFSRLRNGESTAVIGEPHVGKTSFLLQIADSEVQKEYLDDRDKRLIVTYLDLHAIESEYKVENFWEDALAPLAGVDKKTLDGLLFRARKTSYSRQSLEKLLQELARQNTLLVLLLDEFERILLHPNFKDPAFLGLMRSLGTRTGSLALIIASRLPLAKLNQMGRELLDTGSPFFNNMIDVHLPPFNDQEIEALLTKAEPAFSVDEKQYIRRVAGRNPFLLQAMAAALHETGPSAKRVEDAAESFYQHTAQYFDDLWNYMDDDTRSIAVILSLQEVGGRALGSSFNFGEIERVDKYGPELRKLAQRGLAELLEKSSHGWIWDGKNLLVWRGERWGVSCAAFSWWVRDMVITSTRSTPTYSEWLKQTRYIGLLTQKQWDTAQNLIKKIPSGLLRGVGGLAQSLWNEIRKSQ